MSQMNDYANNARHGGSNEGNADWDPRIWASVLAVPVVASLAAAVAVNQDAGAYQIIITGLVFGLAAAIGAAWWVSQNITGGQISGDNTDARLKAALESCQTNVMVADAEYNIVYTNETLRQMMSGNEAAINQDLPQFNASTVIGTNIDVFHKDPAHQRNILDNLRGKTETALELGGRNFDLIVTAITGDDGSRIGTVVEFEFGDEIIRRVATHVEVNFDQVGECEAEGAAGPNHWNRSRCEHPGRA